VANENKVYRFLSSFTSTLPEEIKIQAPTTEDIVDMYVDETDSVYYCTFGSNTINFLKYVDDKYVETYSLEYNRDNYHSFYVKYNQIYILDENGNETVVRRRNISKSDEKSYASYGNGNSSTYYGENPIIGTNTGIIKYDVETKLFGYFNDSLL